jgi:hypothetical protein
MARGTLHDALQSAENRDVNGVCSLATRTGYYHRRAVVRSHPYRLGETAVQEYAHMGYFMTRWGSAIMAERCPSKLRCTPTP